MNRALDPFIEATITDPKSEAFRQCRTMLDDKQNVVENAVALSGNGYFARMPGIGERRLAVLRLDTLLGCKLVPRR